MDAAFWGFAGTLIGVVVGAGATILTTLLQLRHTSQRELAADKLLRSERARDFQRKSLLELQVAVNELAQCYGTLKRHHESAFREGQSWGSRLPPPELTEGIRQSMFRVFALSRRIEGGQVRASVEYVSGLFAEATGAKDRAAADPSAWYSAAYTIRRHSMGMAKCFSCGVSIGSEPRGEVPKDYLVRSRPRRSAPTSNRVGSKGRT